jgi:hypothetical protein
MKRSRNKTIETVIDKSDRQASYTFIHEREKRVLQELKGDL